MICMIYILLFCFSHRRIKSHHAAVLLNLCFILILGNVLFLVGIDRTENEVRPLTPEKETKWFIVKLKLQTFLTVKWLWLIFLLKFQIFSEEKTFLQNLCTAIAVAMHYIWLVAFFIMLADGVEFILYVVYVFHVKRRTETFLLLFTSYSKCHKTRTKHHSANKQMKWTQVSRFASFKRDPDKILFP